MHIRWQRTLQAYEEFISGQLQKCRLESWKYQMEKKASVLPFNPSRQVNNTQLLAHAPTSGMGRRVGRLKVRKLVS